MPNELIAIVTFPLGAADNAKDALVAAMPAATILLMAVVSEARKNLRATEG